MQIPVLFLLACAGSFTAVLCTQFVLCARRSVRKNLLLFAAGVLNGFLFSVLAEFVIRAGRPVFYYHTHGGLTSVKVFSAACFCGAAFFALSLMTAERRKERKALPHRLLFSILMGLCGAVLLEIGFFNFRHFELIGSGTAEMEFPSDRIVGQGFYFNRASWKFHPYRWYSDFSLTVYPNYKKVRNITWTFSDGQPRTVVRLGFNDRAHRSYEWLPDHEFIQGIPRSFLIPLHTVGTTYSIELRLPELKDLPDRSDYAVSAVVTLNKPVPLSLDPVRMALCFLSLFLITAFFPGSPLWDLPLDFRSLPQMASIACLLLLFGGWFVWTVLSSYTGSDAGKTAQKAALTENYSQYDKLVEALAARRYALTEMPHRYLEQLDDPYDMRQREGRVFDYPWDTVYFDGQYYVYFGVVPAVTVLLPYYLLTGRHLALDWLILGGCCLFVLGMYGIYSWFVRRYFRHISFGLYFTGTVLLITPLNLTWCLRRTLVYETAIVSGICFAVWGVYFMLLAERSGKGRLFCFLLSGICSALAVGCRPTMLLVSAVVFAVMIRLVLRAGPYLTRRNVRDVLLFLVPYMLIGLALMKYNYERFGDPFEFGIMYQLTTENRAAGIPLLGPYGRLLSILSSLFTLPAFDMVFPFIHLQQPMLPYNGVILNSDTLLGVFAYPLMLFIPFLPAFRKRLRTAGRFVSEFCGVCLAAALGICVISSGFAAVNRYLTDYLWLAVLPAVFGMFCLFEKCASANWEKLAQTAALLCAAAGVCLFVVLSLTGEGGWFSRINPVYYDRLRYAYSPWL